MIQLTPLRCVPSFKSLAQVLADICKCQITSQTIKYRYKFKSNQKIVSPKILELIPPRCGPSLKSLAQVLADICKCPSSSQTIKYRYKFKSNQKCFFTKIVCMVPQGVCQVWSLQHESKLNIQFQEKPLSTDTSTSRTKKLF